MVGPRGRVIAYVPTKYLPIFPVFHLLSDTDHLSLGTTVIDGNVRWRDSDRRVHGSPLIWSCAVALACPSTDDSKILHGLAQHVIARSEVLPIDLLAL
ncbi:hypothetical protein P692DRAFT_201797736, partial [Suillus brevipes Sb2]